MRYPTFFSCFPQFFWIVIGLFPIFLKRKNLFEKKLRIYLCSCSILLWRDSISYSLKKKVVLVQKNPIMPRPCTVTYGLQRPCGGTARILRVNLRFSWVMTLEYTCFGGPSCLASKNDTWFGVSKALLARHFQAKAVPGHRETLLGKLGFPIGKLPPMWLHNIRASYW